MHADEDISAFGRSLPKHQPPNRFAAVFPLFVGEFVFVDFFGDFTCCGATYNRQTSIFVLHTFNRKQCFGDGRHRSGCWDFKRVVANDCA